MTRGTDNTTRRRRLGLIGHMVLAAFIALPIILGFLALFGAVQNGGWNPRPAFVVAAVTPFLVFWGMDALLNRGKGSWKRGIGGSLLFVCIAVFGIASQSSLGIFLGVPLAGALGVFISRKGWRYFRHHVPARDAFPPPAADQRVSA